MKPALVPNFLMGMQKKKKNRTFDELRYHFHSLQWGGFISQSLTCQWFAIQRSIQTVPAGEEQLSSAKPAPQLKHARREHLSLKGAPTGHDLLIRIAVLQDNHIQVHLLAAGGAM